MNEYTYKTLIGSVGTISIIMLSYVSFEWGYELRYYNGLPFYFLGALSYMGAMFLLYLTLYNLIKRIKGVEQK